MSSKKPGGQKPAGGNKPAGGHKSPGKKNPPPRRRGGVPVLGGGGAQAEVPGLGVTVEVAIKRPLTALQGARDQLAQVPGQMGLPAPDAQAQPYVSPLYQGQEDLSYRVEGALEQAPEVVQQARVQPTDLLLGRRYLSVLGEAKRVAVVGQNLSADGRLVEGARFSFFFKRLLGVYDQRLKTGTQQVKLQTVRAYANLDKLRFRLLSQAQAARQATTADKAGMKQTIAEQQDEAAFVQALQLLDQGQQPDLTTLEAAHRHADRLQAEYGLPLDRRVGAR